MFVYWLRITEFILSSAWWFLALFGLLVYMCIAVYICFICRCVSFRNQYVQFYDMKICIVSA